MANPRRYGADNPAYLGGILVNACPWCILTEGCRRHKPWAMGKVQVWFDGNCPLCSREIGLMRRVIPLLKPLGWAARNRVVLAALEKLYLRFLRVRPLIQQAMRR